MQVRITSSLQQYLPGFVPYIFGMRPPSAIETLCVDHERHILYALSQSGAIQVRHAAVRVECLPSFINASGQGTVSSSIIKYVHMVLFGHRPLHVDMQVCQ